MTATIRYMGSKRALAPTIARHISRQHPGVPVADAFAGTCAIGSALAHRHPIIANDIHAYAATVARALFCGPASRPKRSFVIGELRDAFLANLAALGGVVTERIAEEDDALRRFRQDGRWADYLKYETALAGRAFPDQTTGLPTLETYRAHHDTVPFGLVTMYFAGAYFGIRQAAEIDSLRYAISTAPAERRDLYLYALMTSMSHCAASPGHFAQPLVARTEENTRYIAGIRSRSIYRRFLTALSETVLPRCIDRGTNEVFNQEAADFIRLALAVRETPLVIYADPPYSRAQYSRYYHVLETIVLYDYPEATGKGRYRDGRINTGFSRAGGVYVAMDDLIAAAAETRAPFYLSYPANGLLTSSGHDLLGLLQQHYALVEVIQTTPLAHSTMGGAPGTAAIDVQENVYYARFE